MKTDQETKRFTGKILIKTTNNVCTGESLLAGISAGRGTHSESGTVLHDVI